MKSTRRGFLRGTVVGATALTTSCSEPLHTEKSLAPSEAPPGADQVRVSAEVNGRPRTLEVGPDDSALHAVREQLDLTGCKHGCGHGACGACTMQLDGTPVATCLLPATSLHGRKVTTVEGVAKGGTLAAVQRAFMAEDGLQCGYCTPGFIVEADAFVRDWRAEHGAKEPSRDEVAAALSGHLCRCGAYEGIYRAVQGACAGRYDSGTRSPRYDAKEKVTGAAKYTVDVKLPDMLHAKALHSPHGSATIEKLDWSKALALPGVRGAVDLMHGSKTIRWASQEIMAVAAVDEATATKALALVEIEYDIKPAMVSMEEARASDATLIYGARKSRKPKAMPNSSEGAPPLRLPWDGNTRGPMTIFSKKGGKAKRAIEAARDGQGTLVEDTWVTQPQVHTTLEPHAAVAHWPTANTLKVHLSTQAVRACAEDLAEHFDLDRDAVTVVADYIGAGFGGKGKLESEAIIAATLAKVCGAPVRYVLDRREEIMLGGHRPQTELRLAAAVDDDGALAGITAQSYSNQGAAIGHAVTPLIRIIYPDVPKDLEDYDVITHGPPGKPFRGPGGPQAYWALEQAIDALAHARGEDPLQMRHRFDPNPARQPLYGWAEGLDVWKNRPAPGSEKGRFRRGVGLAFGAWFAFCEPKTHIQIQTSAKGVVVSTASQDMGNGTRTIIANTVAEQLGMKPSDVIVKIGNSNLVPGPTSAGSRTVSSVVPTCVAACDLLKEELFDDAKDRLGLRGSVPSVNGIEHEGGIVTWAKLVESSPAVTVVGRRPRDKGGYFLFPINGLGIEKYITSCIQVMEIEVDTRLGKTRATQAWGGYSIGPVVSPEVARSQAMGGIVQAVSYALYEERRLAPQRGYALTGGMEDYRIMGIGDAPRMHLHFHEGGYDKVPQRSVGIGEIVTVSPAAAIGNAMFNATGWRPKELPIRPDRVLKGVSA